MGLPTQDLKEPFSFTLMSLLCKAISLIEAITSLIWVQRLASVYNLWFLLKKTGGLCINN
jgi:hypothetical protein